MQNLETDIAVISAGTAGLAAAVAAAESGARVIALEKSGNTGGTANMGSGLFAVESRLQKVKHMALTREAAFNMYMDFTHWRVNARLVKAFMDKSASTIDWLEAMGVEFLDLGSHGMGNYPTQHTVKGKEGSGNRNAPAATMMSALAQKAAELGVQILLKTPVKKILKEGERVTGVVAEDASGEEIQVKAGAVIIACGGFGMGGPMVLPGVNGDGIRMAKEVGGFVSEPPAPAGLPPKAPGRPPRGGGGFSSVGFAFEQPCLMVNLLGERFMNEELLLRFVFTGNALGRQKDKCAFNIFDEDTKNHFVEKGFDFAPGGVQNPATKASDFDASIQRDIEAGAENLFVADSVEELAEKTGIDPNGLRQTLDEYNLACDTGRDEIFHKRFEYLRPVRKPRFYASKRLSNATNRWDGIRINHRTEVMTGDYAVIPGLYAAGIDCACEIYYDTYPMIMPATAMGFAINSGRIAGENAAALIRQ